MTTNARVTDRHRTERAPHRPGSRSGKTLGLAPGRAAAPRSFGRQWRQGRGGAQTSSALCRPCQLAVQQRRPENAGPLCRDRRKRSGGRSGRPVAPVWNLTYFGKHAVRTTLLAGKCDASIGLPQDKDFMGPRVIFSKPLLQVGYALVVPKSLAVASLDDLSGRRVAVQFATTPQSLLADRDDIQTVTFREPEEAMASAGRGPGGRRLHLGTDRRLREQDRARQCRITSYR